jgi:ribokinase
VLNPAPARPLPAELLDLGPLLTPNEAEARALGGAEALAERTGAPVVVTLGARGALIVERGHAPEPVAPHAVDAVDTTGAGDAFSGALTAELARGTELAAAARFAAVAAALSTRRPGARAGMPGRAAVQDAS